jgi:hypothetical protein
MIDVLLVAGAMGWGFFFYILFLWPGHRIEQQQKVDAIMKLHNEIIRGKEKEYELFSQKKDDEIEELHRRLECLRQLDEAAQKFKPKPTQRKRR